MLVADYYSLRVSGRGGERFLLYVEVLEITEFDQIRAKVEIIDERHPIFCLFPILFDSHLCLFPILFDSHLCLYIWVPILFDSTCIYI